MKRITLFLILTIFSLVCLTSLASAQSATKLGFGAFGGLSIPILQEDQGNGTEYGLKVRWGAVSMFTVEPYLAFVKWGEPDPIEVLSGGPDFSLGIDGSKVTAFGVDLVLGNGVGKMGVSPYFVGGVASFKVKNDDTGFEHSSLGWSAGLGLGIGFTPSLAIDVRGKVNVAPQDGGGSKKSASIVGGLNYAFGLGY